MLPAELLAAFDDPEREAQLTALEAAASVSPERNRVVAQRSLRVLRAAVRDFVGLRGYRYAW